MLLLYKFLIFLTAIVVFLGFNGIFLMPSYFFVWAFIMLLFVIVSILHIFKKQNINLKDKLFFLITPIFLMCSSVLASIFLNTNLIKLLFSIGIAIMFFLYLENLFLYFRMPAKYQIYSLENISSYINLISIFFISSSFYGLKILLGVRFKWFIFLIAIEFFAVFILFCQNFWVNKISANESKKYLLIAILILLEIYLIILLLPSNYYVNGLIFSLAYYVIAGLIKYKLLDKLEKRIIMKYSSISFILFIFLLVTTKWT
ncbi:hypothetical protein ACFL23_01125 [Patescibacteria group bacterium]